jgi:hypothetical protein
MTTFNVGQTVKLLKETPEYGDWATGYIESASCGVYGVRVWGHHLYRVTAADLASLCQHVYPDRTLEDTALEFTGSQCGDVVAYW